MFGYVRPVLGELDETQKKIFQSYYCGLCKAIASRYSGIARMTLTYDCTFLAILLDSLVTEENDIEGDHCAAVIRRPVMKNESLNVCADVNVLLAYYNVCDDNEDQPGMKAKGAKKLLKGSYNQAKSRQIYLDTVIEEYMQKLWQKEKEGCSSEDEMGDLFGQLLSSIADLMTENNDAVLLAYHLGKYIYLLDALDDYKDDIKTGSYNVYYQTYGQCDDLLQKAEFNLQCSLSKIAEHYQKLPIKKNRELLDNIIYIGLIQYFIQKEEKA